MMQTSQRWLFVSLMLFIAVGLSGVGQVIAQTEPGLYALPDGRSRLTTSASMAFAKDGRLLVTANMLNNTVSIVEPGQSAVRAEIAVGKDPRTVAVTPDSTRAAVVNRGDGTLSIINLDTLAVIATHPLGVLPYGVVMLDNVHALIALQATHEIIKLDITTGNITTRIDTLPAPAGLALWGDFLYVSHLWDGDLSLIYLPQNRHVDQVASGIDVSIAQSITIDAQRGLAYLPQTRLNSQNQALTFDTTVFPVVNVFDLREFSRQRPTEITLDTADRPVNMPFSTALDGQRRWLYVANAGSNNVSVIDLTNGLAVANLPTGINPRTVLLSRDNGTLYVHNMIEGTIMLFDTRTFRLIDRVTISVLNIPSDLYLGAQLFHSATDPRLSADQWLSCASCHFDGLSDGRVWNLYGNGGRNTPLLFDLSEKPRLNWAGTWDEIADVELKIRGIQGGNGFIDDALVDAALGNPHDALSPDLETLTAYLNAFSAPQTPAVTDADHVAQIARGGEIFASLNCASCHNNSGTLHDLGTGGAFIAPPLKWLWLSAPYLHDGSAKTLLDVFIMPGDHQLLGTLEYADIQALEAYLNSLPQD